MDASFLIKLLSALDTVIMEQSADGSFKILGTPPNWFKNLFYQEKTDAKKFTIEDELSFLGNFVIDATEFWRLQQAGQILWSGPWEEKLESGEYAIFEAGAVFLEDRKILIVRLLSHMAIAEREVIQQAKDRLLSFEDLFRTEQDMEKYRDYLEKEVEQRTLQMRRAEQQALVNAKLASIGELVASVAHEVNNPLTGIIGYAQLLADSQDVPPHVKADLQKIHEESQRTVRIVQNLLRFARRYKPSKDIVDINELLERTLELKAYKLKTSNIGLSVNLAADIPLILADYNQIQQVILNVITNARQAIEETKRKGKITVVTEAIPGYVKISVTDNGHGISPENITRIFDPFFTTKPAGSGSGLGLSICHGIITEHGGNIYVESTLNKGTTFIIGLPIATAEQAIIKEKPSKEKGRRPRRKLTQNILVVEDEPSIRAVLTRTLSDEGYHVQAVSDGKVALAKMAKNVYDLFLVDLKMPGMSGRELYKTVKKKYPDVAKKVVFITGDVMTADTQNFLASTGRPYLIKPFDFKDITNVIEQVLAGNNGKPIS